MRYEYQVLEGDAPGIPADMLNEQGNEGWMMAGVVKREVEGNSRWIFYFMREKTE